MGSYQAKAYLPSRLPMSQNLRWSVRMIDWSGSALRRTFILQEGPEGHLLLVLFGTYESLARTIWAFFPAPGCCAERQPWFVPMIGKSQQAHGNCATGWEEIVRSQEQA
jgi:hypothetical protein